MLKASAPERWCASWRRTVFSCDLDFQKIGFYSIPQCLNMMLFAWNHGVGKLNRSHRIDCSFFMWWHVSTSKPLFNNPVHLNLQWISYCFSTMLFCWSHFAEAHFLMIIKTMNIVKLFIIYTQAFPSLMHALLHLQLSVSVLKLYLPQPTEVHTCMMMLFEKQMKSFSRVVPHCSHINIDGRESDAFCSFCSD